MAALVTEVAGAAGILVGGGRVLTPGAVVADGAWARGLPET